MSAAVVIMFADAAMSLDNVVALAAIAGGNLWLLGGRHPSQHPDPRLRRLCPDRAPPARAGDLHRRRGVPRLDRRRHGGDRSAGRRAGSTPTRPRSGSSPRRSAPCSCSPPEGPRGRGPRPPPRRRRATAAGPARARGPAGARERSRARRALASLGRRIGAKARRRASSRPAASAAAEAEPAAKILPPDDAHARIRRGGACGRVRLRLDRGAAGRGRFRPAGVSGRPDHFHRVVLRQPDLRRTTTNRGETS